MKIRLKLDDGRRLRPKLPYVGAAHVRVEDEPCPVCRKPAPLLVRGVHQHRGHDVIEADAIALCCDARVGRLVVTVDTIFGLEEDSRVLNGPWRVY